jgi:enediyne biosynthesis protein E4
MGNWLHVSSGNPKNAIRQIAAAAAIALPGFAALLSAGISAPVYETLPPSKTGIRFVHDNARSDRRYLPESMGPGVAIFDYDNDGWMDLYFVNSGLSDFFTPKRPLRNALYRNNHDGTFTDVTGRAGVGGRDFGIGVSTCDYNRDGNTDLFITNYGHNILYRNNGNGTFTDVTAAAGLDSPGLYTAAVWFDYDRNGTQDLFVGHFVEYRKSLERDCRYNGVPHYCYPLSYDPWPSRLYRNNGDGTFTDVSVVSGIGRHQGKAFGAVATDINNDGYLDLFVANDSVANFLFLNDGRGGFREIGLEAGVAYNADGAARSGMGVDAADFDGDGLQDLFVANFNRERFSIYRNRGDLSFQDVAGITGIGAATQMYSGWGVKFYDFDLDGEQDLIVANGHPDDLIEKISDNLTYREPLLLFHNQAGRFVSMGARGGVAFEQNHPARGLAVGDLDNDGHPDVVIAMSGEAPLILHHRGTEKHWIGLVLKESAAGAIISWSAGGRRRSRLKTSGGSYLSANDPRELLGIGKAATVDWIEVRWPEPGGRTDRFENVRAGRYYALRRGGSLE